MSSSIDQWTINPLVSPNHLSGRKEYISVSITILRFDLESLRYLAKVVSLLDRVYEQLYPAPYFPGISEHAHLSGFHTDTHVAHPNILVTFAPRERLLVAFHTNSERFWYVYVVRMN
jgi:hypothetical protein